MREQRQEGGEKEEDKEIKWEGGAHRQAEMYIEGEKEMRMSDCLVYPRDCHEENGQQIQTLHTHEDT